MNIEHTITYYNVQKAVHRKSYLETTPRQICRTNGRKPKEAYDRISLVSVARGGDRNAAGDWGLKRFGRKYRRAWTINGDRGTWWVRIPTFGRFMLPDPEGFSPSTSYYNVARIMILMSWKKKRRISTVTTTMSYRMCQICLTSKFNIFIKMNVHNIALVKIMF